MPPHTTIVIGAGMAGLAAACTLQEAGYDVKILEGRDRLGGRTYTEHSLGVSNDLGAAWIHGPLANPMTTFAKRFDVGTAYTDFDNRFGNSTIAFDADGSQLDTAQFTTGMRFFNGAYDRLFTSVLYERPSRDVRSMADLYRSGLPGVGELSEVERKGFYYGSVVRVQYGDAADLHEIDWRLSNRYVKLPGGDLILPGGGFGRIVAGLADGLTIETDTVVESIAYGEDGVRVRTNRGEERADHVIVTVPLGVLKAGRIAFFPALPAEKQAAIQRIGYGHYEKLALKFPRCFWPTEPHRLNYLPGTQPELFTSWVNVAHYSGEPILVAMHAGSRARHINRWPDDKYIAEAMIVLRKIFGADVPDPVAYVRTEWETDPFALGSYSYSAVGGYPEDRPTLAAPVAERVHFAGEATHPRYFGTVHGAWETGVRAAREIMSNA
ncbi:MAG: NAD(P)/FAD-dependent oxidoreductase [Caldilineaceae bacterium]|nr:FAD-dependent oxidoreductase [Caldilineaceae bacterium]